MAMIAVKVIQTYKAKREIILFVDAKDPEDALEQVASGSIDIPSFDDPFWKTSWDLQNEEYELG